MPWGWLAFALILASVVVSQATGRGGGKGAKPFLSLGFATGACCAIAVCQWWYAPEAAG